MMAAETEEAAPELAGILAGAHRWESTVSPDAVKRRVGTAVAPFLGGNATRDLMGTVSETGENLLSTLEPVIALFLGCRAASRMFDRVVDRSILKAG